MTDWQDIESAPRDGSPVQVGKRKFFQLWPFYPVYARFMDGRWKMDFGNGDWRSYDPQPNCWKPAKPQP